MLEHALMYACRCVVRSRLNRTQIHVITHTGEAEFVGDFRNGYIDFGWDTFSEEEQIRKRGIELNNGRAAQMGIIALMVHEGIDNNP